MNDTLLTCMSEIAERTQVLVEKTAALQSEGEDRKLEIKKIREEQEAKEARLSKFEAEVEELKRQNEKFSQEQAREVVKMEEEEFKKTQDEQFRAVLQRAEAVSRQAGSASSVEPVAERTAT